MPSGNRLPFEYQGMSYEGIRVFFKSFLLPFNKPYSIKFHCPQSLGGSSIYTNTICHVINAANSYSTLMSIRTEMYRGAKLCWHVYMEITFDVVGLFLCLFFFKYVLFFSIESKSSLGVNQIHPCVHVQHIRTEQNQKIVNYGII